MSWIYAELVAVSLAAMVSPTTLTFCVLALVLGDRPLRTGLLFYAGALTATLAVGVAAAFVLGDVAASDTPSSPKTWVAVLDLVAASFLLVWAAEALAQPAGPREAGRGGRTDGQGRLVICHRGRRSRRGARQPGRLHTDRAEDDLGDRPDSGSYAVQWLFFALVSLLPLLIAIVLLLVAPGWAGRLLDAAQGWLTRHAIQVALVIIVLLAVALLRNGIAGLTS